MCDIEACTTVCKDTPNLAGNLALQPKINEKTQRELPNVAETLTKPRAGAPVSSQFCSLLKQNAGAHTGDPLGSIIKFQRVGSVSSQRVCTFCSNLAFERLDRCTRRKAILYGARVPKTVVRTQQSFASRLLCRLLFSDNFVLMYFVLIGFVACGACETSTDFVLLMACRCCVSRVSVCVRLSFSFSHGFGAWFVLRGPRFGVGK